MNQCRLNQGVGSIKVFLDADGPGESYRELMGEDCRSFDVPDEGDVLEDRIGSAGNHEQSLGISAVHGLDHHPAKKAGSKEATEALSGTQETSTAERSTREMLDSENGKLDAESAEAAAESCDEAKVGSEVNVELEFEAGYGPFEMRFREKTSPGYCEENAADGRSVCDHGSKGVGFAGNDPMCSSTEIEGQQHPYSPPTIRQETYPVQVLDEQRKAQLYAQIRVYGALLQRSVPSEDLLLAAFSDFTRESVKTEASAADGSDHNAWEKQWRAAIARIHSKTSPSSSTDPHQLDIPEASSSETFDNAKHSLRDAFGKHQSPDAESSAVVSSPSVGLESLFGTPSYSDAASAHPTPCNMEFLFPSAANKSEEYYASRTAANRSGEYYASRTVDSVAALLTMGETPEARPSKRKKSGFETLRQDAEVMPNTNDAKVIGHHMSGHSTSSVCNFMFPTTFRGSITTFPEQPYVAIEPLHLTPTSNPIATLNGQTQLRLESPISDLNQLREHAEQASAWATWATRENETMWQDLKSRNIPDLSRYAELQIVSSIVSMRTAATVAKAAAAAAGAAYEASLHANTMRERTLRLVFGDRLEQASMLQQASEVLEDRPSTGFEIVPTENIDAAAFVAGERSANLEALATAAALTSKAVSEIRTVMAMGESVSFTLTNLMEIGFEGIENLLSSLPSSKESENAANKMRMSNTDLQIEPVLFGSAAQNIERVDALGQNEQVEAERCRTPLPRPPEDNPCDGMDNRQPLDASSNGEVQDNVGSIALDVKQGIITNEMVEKKQGIITNEMVENSAVEVLFDEAVLPKVWHPAKVLQLDHGKVLVQYDLHSENGTNALQQEWIDLDGAACAVPRIRWGVHANNWNSNKMVGGGKKKRLRVEMEDQKWAAGDLVDVWIQWGWREGKIVEVLDDGESMVRVFFPGGVSGVDSASELVRMSDIRPSLTWNHEFHCWIISSSSSSRQYNNDGHHHGETNNCLSSKQLQDCPHSKRRKVEEGIIHHSADVSMTTHSFRPDDSTSTCQASSYFSRCTGQDGEVSTSKGIECELKRGHGSNVTPGFSKLSKKETRLTDVSNKNLKGACERTSTRIITTKVDGKPRLLHHHHHHQRTDLKHVGKPSSIKGVEEQQQKQLPVLKSGKASSSASEEGLPNRVINHLGSTKRKPPLTQLQSNIVSCTTRRLPTSMDMEASNPSGSARKNEKDGYDRAENSKPQASFAVKKHAAKNVECIGNRVVQAASVKKRTEKDSRKV